MFGERTSRSTVQGQEKAESMARLRIVEGSQHGQLLVLRPPGPCLVGRAARCQFQILDRHVSRRHFSINFRNEGYVLADLESSAGTFVNDERTERSLLKDGDRVRAGTSILELELVPKDALVGRELGGYHILEHVGSGGMGTVYRALQVSLRRVVALKVLDRRLSSDQDFSALFIQEARAAAELSHPNVVRVYDVNRLDGVLFYAMEFAAKGSVEDLIRKQIRLGVHKALDLAHQTTLGLEYGERVGIIHRDIKPANLMIEESGRLKIGDLGLARRIDDPTAGSLLPESGSAASATGGISGSPPYMPPEQVLGRPTDHRGDLYALGASLHEMLTGVVPFRGKTVRDVLVAHIKEAPPDPRTYRHDLPGEVARLIQTLMAKSPDDRPASASETRERLERLLASTPVETRRPGKRRGARILRSSIYALALALAAAVGFVVTSALL